jgi:hypothetical protein
MYYYKKYFYNKKIYTLLKICKIIVLRNSLLVFVTKQLQLHHFLYNEDNQLLFTMTFTQKENSQIFTIPIIHFLLMVYPVSNMCRYILYQHDTDRCSYI